jgi:hypothetical protein
MSAMADTRISPRAPTDPDTIALTEPVIQQLTAEGWAVAELRVAAARGPRYDPRREMLVTLPRTNR